MKDRFDVFLYKNGFFDSREKSKAAIMAGEVKYAKELIDKPGYQIDTKANKNLVEIKEKQRYVSRGGYKLEKAISTFEIDIKNLICMDVGASTGGFTNCMLKNGAKKIYSIDVGYGQLDYRLRNDKRVINIERTNFRYIDEELIDDKIDFVTVDVSFISLKLIFPKLKKFIDNNYQIVALIKPQFEADKEQVNNGIIKSPKIHCQTIKKCMDCAKENGLNPAGLSYSPIKGQKGNVEFLLYLSEEKYNNIDEDYVIDVIHQSKNI